MGLLTGVTVCMGKLRAGRWSGQVLVRPMVWFSARAGGLRAWGVQAFSGWDGLPLGIGLLVRIQACLWPLGHSPCAAVLFVPILSGSLFCPRLSMSVPCLLPPEAALSWALTELPRVILLKDVTMPLRL